MIREIYALFCILLIIVSAPFMALLWVLGFIAACLIIGARSGYNAMVKTEPIITTTEPTEK